MTDSRTAKRRAFIKQLTTLGLAGSLNPVFGNPLLVDDATTPFGKDGYTVLFQGDSITDGNRTRNQDWNHVLGHGYQFIIASKLWYEQPQRKFHFLNRGISGNKVIDLAARWQADTLDLKPNLLSILVGINDVAAFINGNKDFDSQRYEEGYRNLLQQASKQLPTLRLVLCEPFILPVGRVKENWRQYSSEVEKRGEIVKKLSLEFKAIFVPFQAAFNKASMKAPAAYWIWDGIHPMPAGHELMAREWMRQVGKTIPFLK